jgi:Bifunctional DNA primase/polymerase, N-terminal/AAA domain
MAALPTTAAGPAGQPQKLSQDAPGRPNGQGADTPILEAALDYAAMTGRPVFFLAGDKRPLKGSHGHLDATADPDELRKLFHKHPGGIGIGAPVPAGEFVLDIDPRSGGDKSLDLLIREYGPLPPTVTTLSGGKDGGQHLRFRLPPGEAVSSRHNKLGPGLDVKAAGQGYVVLPPSPHQSGRVYRWKPFCDPESQAVAEAPAWMVELLKEKPRRAGESTRKLQSEWLAGIPQGEPGGRDWFIYQSACSLRARSTPYDEARALILEAARNCRPPYEEKRALEKLDGAWKKFPAGGSSPTLTDDREWEKFIGAAVWPEEADPGLVGERLDDWEPEPATGQPATETSTPNNLRPEIRFRTARQIAEETPATPNWTARPWVVAGGMTEVTGKIKVAGKTTWVTHLCREVLDGRPFMGEPTAQSPVVYLTEQTDASFREALRRAGLLDRDDFHVMSWRDTVGLEWPAVVRLAVEEAKKTGARLLVVDTLPQFARLAGEAENSAGDAMAALQPLQEAAGDGLAVVTVRHDRKSGGEVGDSARGSSAFGGAMDVVVSIRRPAGAHRETIRQIDALSRFDETPASLVIEKTATGYVALGSMAAMAEADAEAAMLDAMPGSEEEAKSLPDLLEAANENEGRRVKRENGRLAVAKLLERGTVRRTGKGKRGDAYRFWIAGEVEHGTPVAVPIF